MSNSVSNPWKYLKPVSKMCIMSKNTMSSAQPTGEAEAEQSGAELALRMYARKSAAVGSVRTISSSDREQIWEEIE